MHIARNRIAIEEKIKRMQPGFRLALALAWTAAVLAVYYLVHKPIGPAQAASLVRAIAQVLAALALGGLAGGLGWRLVKAVEMDPLERFAVQAALGWGLLGLAWLGIGLLGAYSRSFGWIALLLGWAALHRESVAWFRELGGLVDLWRSAGRTGKTLGALCGFLAGGQLLLALAPPTRWDALMYHLELPRRYLETGRFVFTPWNPYWGQPQLVEMIYTWGAALAGLETAALLGWLFQATLLLGVLGSAARRAGPAGAWAAVGALLAGYSFRWLMSAAYSDGMAALAGYAVLASALAWVETRDKRWAWLAGILAGCALLGKLTAGLVLVALGVTIFLFYRQPLLQRAKLVAQTCLLACLPALPWLLANAGFTGNPLFPHFIFTTWASSERLAYFHGAGPPAVLQVLWLPLAATWFGVDTNAVSGMPVYASDVGPLLVLLALPGIVATWKKPAGQLLFAWMAVGWVGMAAGSFFSPLLWQTRLYFALFPAAALAAGFGWQALARVRVVQVRLARVLASLALLVLGLSLVQDALRMAELNPLATLAGGQGRHKYLETALGSYPAAMQAVAGLPAGGRSLFLWEPRGLYAPSSAQPDSWIDRWYLDRQEYEEPQAILAAWRAQGFTHLLVYQAGAAYERANRRDLAPADWLALDSLLAGLPLPSRAGQDYALYRLSP